MVNLKCFGNAQTTAGHIALLLFLAVIPAVAFGQYFNKRIDFMGYEQPEVGFSIEKMLSGNYLLFHGTYSETGDSIGLGLTELSLTGEVLSQSGHFVESGILYPGYANTSFRTMYGRFVSSGSKAWNQSIYESLITLCRYDENGELQWINMEGDSVQQVIGRAAVESVNGNFAATGSITDVDIFHTNGLLWITDSLGSTIAWKNYGGNQRDRFYSIYPTQDGGYILGGDTRSFLNPGRRNHYVVKTDSLGNQEWMHVAGTPRDEFPANVIQTADGNYVYSSAWNHYEITSSNPFNKLYLCKLDQDGEVMWENEYLDEPMFAAYLKKVIELPNGDLAGIGYSENGTWSHLLKTDSNGNEKWLRNIGHPSALNSNLGIQFGYDLMLEEEDMGFVGVGWIFVPPGDSLPGQDLWVFRTDSMGCLVPGCHIVDNVEVHEEEVLVSMYPNPVKDLLSVHLKSGPMPRGAQMELYDMHGRRHSTTTINPGATTYILPMGHLPAGMYVLRCVTGGEVVWSGKVLKE